VGKKSGDAPADYGSTESLGGWSRPQQFAPQSGGLSDYGPKMAAIRPAPSYDSNPSPDPSDFSEQGTPQVSYGSDAPMPDASPQAAGQSPSVNQDSASGDQMAPQLLSRIAGMLRKYSG
jgi:hypothetical protein